MQILAKSNLVRLASLYALEIVRRGGLLSSDDAELTTPTWDRNDVCNPLG